MSELQYGICILNPKAALKFVSNMCFPWNVRIIVVITTQERGQTHVLIAFQVDAESN